jgi:hypothetical protein
VNKPPCLLTEAMDISPAPPVNPPSRLKSQGKRPRAFKSGARLFRNDISNNNSLCPSPSIVAAPTQKATGSTSAKRIQRAPLPTEWLTALSVAEVPANQVCVIRTTIECTLSYAFFVSASQEPSSPLDDLMDVDISYMVSSTATINAFYIVLATAGCNKPRSDNLGLAAGEKMYGSCDLTPLFVSLIS